MDTYIDNAKITGTMLGKEDHGIMTFYLYVEFDNGGCGYGGYVLDEYDKAEKRRFGTAAGMQAITEILDCVGVDTWEELTGSFIRCEHEGWGGNIIRIGHLIKNKWLDLDEFFENWRATHEQR